MILNSKKVDKNECKICGFFMILEAEVVIIKANLDIFKLILTRVGL